MPEFSSIIHLATNAARSGALAALADNQRLSDDSDEKGDVNVGHHAIVTGHDVAAQKEVLRALVSAKGECLDIGILTEEKCTDAPDGLYVFGKDDRHSITTRAGITFIVDPLDGSSFRNRHLPEWSTSVGVYVDGCHIGGAICAPEISGGLEVIGEIGRGTVILGGRRNGRGKITPRPRKKMIVCAGLDLCFIPEFARFMRAFPKEVQTTTTNTCALALAFLVAGYYDAVVQPVQAPWDWAAGYPLVLAAGGTFQFYHYRDGNIVLMDGPDVESYDPVRRNTAFIAGHAETVTWLTNLLQENWGGSTTP